MDPRSQAAGDLDALLKRAKSRPWSAAQCEQALHLVTLAPGRLRNVAHTLSAQRDAASTEALLQLPPHVPGAVEGVFGAIEAGVAREGADGEPVRRMLAIDFTESRARWFGDALQRAERAFGRNFERLQVGGAAAYRIHIAEGRGTLAGRASAAAIDLEWLHRRLAKLRGTRVWLNGWVLNAEHRYGPSVQVHLVAAWLRWAGTQTRRGPRA